MSKKVELIINGEAYPCRPTMGAMLRFKKETGKEVTEIVHSEILLDDEGKEIGRNEKIDFSDLLTYLWCCIASASKAEGKDFSLSLMDFADSITPDDLDEWTQTVSEQPSAGEAAVGEKKSK